MDNSVLCASAFLATKWRSTPSCWRDENSYFIFRTWKSTWCRKYSEQRPSYRVGKWRLRKTNEILRVVKRQLWRKKQKEATMTSPLIVFFIIGRRRCFLPKEPQKTGQWPLIKAGRGINRREINIWRLVCPTAERSLAGWNGHLREESAWETRCLGIHCLQCRLLRTTLFTWSLEPPLQLFTTGTRWHTWVGCRLVPAVFQLLPPLFWKAFWGSSTNQKTSDPSLNT